MTASALPRGHAACAGTSHLSQLPRFTEGETDEQGEREHVPSRATQLAWLQGHLAITQAQFQLVLGFSNCSEFLASCFLKLVALCQVSIQSCHSTGTA